MTVTEVGVDIASAPAPALQQPRTPVGRTPSSRRRSHRLQRKWFYIFISPWIVGLLAFTLIPMIMSLVLSFMKWDLLTAPTWVGFANYAKAFTGDPLVWQSLGVTFYFAVTSIPLTLVVSLVIAILLHRLPRGSQVFRTIYYLPVIVSGIPVTILWMYILNPDGGLMNRLLALIGIKGPGWIYDAKWVMPSLLLMSVWAVGGTVVIWLAGLSGVDGQLYEAAQLDGANRWQQFRHVTVPALAPVITFNLVMGVIGALQTFDQAYVMADGTSGAGPHNSMLFYAYYIYKNGFEAFKMGYASALAWILFVIILVITLLIFRTTPLGTYSEDD